MDEVESIGAVRCAHGLLFQVKQSELIGMTAQVDVDVDYLTKGSTRAMARAATDVSATTT